jgi:hypothetical protein
MYKINSTYEYVQRITREQFYKIIDKNQLRKTTVSVLQVLIQIALYDEMKKYEENDYTATVNISQLS